VGHSAEVPGAAVAAEGVGEPDVEEVHLPVAVGTTRAVARPAEQRTGPAATRAVVIVAAETEAEGSAPLQELGAPREVDIENPGRRRDPVGRAGESGEGEHRIGSETRISPRSHRPIVEAQGESRAGAARARIESGGAVADGDRAHDVGAGIAGEDPPVEPLVPAAGVAGGVQPRRIGVGPAHREVRALRQAPAYQASRRQVIGRSPRGSGRAPPLRPARGLRVEGGGE
jgi:hypothetical protein